jgi:hypothetical protein
MPAAAPIAVNQVVDVWISVQNNQLRVSLDGETLAEFSPLTAPAGLFTMGIQEAKAQKGPQTAVFSDLILWRPPYSDPPSPSPSVSPSPSTQPSPSPSPSRKPSPAATP